MRKFFIDATVLLIMGAGVAAFMLINALQYAGVTYNVASIRRRMGSLVQPA